MILLQLYWEFFKVGLFSIGGGMATIPFLENLATKTGWFTLQNLLDIVAVAESTPGPIGVNSATYVGFLTSGKLGAIVSTMGLITPSIIIILIIAKLLEKFKGNRIVNNVFYGLRPASTALIASAGISLIVLTFWTSNGDSILSSLNIKGIALALILLFLTRWFKPTKKLHPIIFILFSALMGIIFSL